MAEVIIRDIREADTEFAFKLLRDLAEHVGELEHFGSVMEDVRRDAFGPNRLYETLIAEVDDKNAGLIIWFFTYSTYVGKRCLFVNDIIVEPWARGLDVGRRLMARMATVAAENDCARIDLHVHVENAARGFYKRIGMEQSEEVPCILRGQAMQDLAALDGKL